MTGNMQPHKGTNFLQNSLQIQCNQIQIFKGFFCLFVELDKLIIKFTWEFQGSRIVKANKLEGEEQGMRNSFKDFNWNTVDLQYCAWQIIFYYLLL